MEESKLQNIAVLYITRNRLPMLRVTLPHLLESHGIPGGHLGVVIVDNASTDGTSEYLASLRHPSIEQVIHNKENQGLRLITNNFWTEREGHVDYLGKVDDDTIIPVGFFMDARDNLAKHTRNAVVGAIHWDPVDLPPFESYQHNLIRGMEIVLQRNIGGCCYLMKSTEPKKWGHIADVGYFRGGWSEYQWMLNDLSRLCGYLYPFRFAKHLQWQHRYQAFLNSIGSKIEPNTEEILFEIDACREECRYELCRAPYGPEAAGIGMSDKLKGEYTPNGCRYSYLHQETVDVEQRPGQFIQADQKT